MAPEASARLLEWTDSAKPDGMGIGLSISRAIVEAHEGDIWLEDGREGADSLLRSPRRARGRAERIPRPRQRRLSRSSAAPIDSAPRVANAAL
ncbi:MAG TPA: hypothetical protein VMS43_17000 [Allosphingosinicella sp.]|nr:hypothetical protein [Allosphingosinicella sp.]